jgi:hypothetical protein
MKTRFLAIYAQAHGCRRRIFNDLASSYDQAHGSYDQAHAAKFASQLATDSPTTTYCRHGFFAGRVYGNGFMVFMVMV